MTAPSLAVVDHEPHSWFLLRDGEGYFLDVNCNRSFVGFDILLKLTEPECAAVVENSHNACQALAASVQYGPSAYSDRNISNSHGPAVSEAIDRWRQHGH